MSSELLATYAGLGTYDGENYYKGNECLACVKDLIRALKGDDDTCEIRRHLGKAGILQKDLLSILVNFSDDAVLRNDVIRLLVNLTQPAYLCFGKSYPRGKEKDAMRCFMEVNHYLRQYKEAFVAGRVMQVLGSVLAEMCRKDWQGRDDDDIVLVERILVLIRNILHVPPDPQEEKRTEDDVSVHDQVIWNLHLNGIDELLLFLGSNPDEKQWCMHVLEILFLILREQSPAVLAKTGKTRTVEERKQDESAVDDLIERERAHKQAMLQICGTRHSRFGGTYVVKNQKSITEQNFIYHRPLQSLGLLSRDVEKRPRRTNKLRRPAPDVPSERCSTYSIRIILRNLCCQFLDCCYNSIMSYVLHNVKHNKAMDNDETYYLWALRFMMEFNRLDTFNIGLVGETLELQTLHYVIQLIASYYESMLVEKKIVQDAKLWGQRLHFAVQAYKELLLCIQKMFASEDKAVRESAKVMEGNILYHPEYRDVFVTLLRNFMEVLQTRACLRDIMEATHVYIKNMETYAKTNKHIVVMEKKKKTNGRRKKKDGDEEDEDEAVPFLTEDQLVDLWEKMDGRVSELLQGSEPLPRSAIPFDAASDQPMEEQRKFAVGKIRRLLQSAKHPDGVALFRAAREVWPDDVFGKSGMSVDEEMEAIRNLFVHPSTGVAELAAVRVTKDETEGNNEEEEEEEDGEESHATDAIREQSYELEFDFKKYIMRFCHNKVVYAYCLVLRDYRTNPEHINHAVIKMLFRIAVEMKMAPLLYQLSVFRTMQAILHEPSVPRYGELQKFSRYVVSGFFAMASTNAMMFAEVLFWKTTADVYELTEGYGAKEKEMERKQLGCMWTREQEEELAQMYERFKGDEDIVACIEAALSKDVPRTRKQIVSQLVAQGLVGSRGQLQRKQHKKKTGEWSEEELTRLREMFVPHEDPKEAIKMVAAEFPDRGIRDVTQQLRAMNLIPDSKARKRQRPAADQSDSDQDDVRNESSIKSTPSGSGSPPKTVHKKQKKHKGTSVTSLGGSPDLRQLVISLHQDGYTQQLAWLEAYLRDEANDRAVDDDWEDMCIVPVSEQLGEAMQMAQVHELLAGLSMQPPSQQEMYWRIPSRMSPDELKRAADLLVSPTPSFGGGGAEVGSGEEDLIEQEEESTGFGSCAEAEGEKEKLFRGGGVSSHHSESEDDEGDEERAVTAQEILSELKRKRTTQKRTVSEQKGEEDEGEELQHEDPAPCTSKRPRLSRKAFLLDDDYGGGDSLVERRSSPGCGPKKKSRKLLDSDSEGGSDVEACGGGGDGDQSEGRRTQEGSTHCHVSTDQTHEDSPPEDG